MSDVSADVITMVAKRARPPQRVVVLNSRIDELGIDSLAAVELIFDLEEKFDIQIPYNSNANFELETVGEIVDVIKSLVGGKS